VAVGILAWHVRNAWTRSDATRFRISNGNTRCSAMITYASWRVLPAHMLTCLPDVPGKSKTVQHCCWTVFQTLVKDLLRVIPGV
jgi:hypothetical protein